MCGWVLIAVGLAGSFVSLLGRALDSVVDYCRRGAGRDGAEAAGVRSNMPCCGCCAVSAERFMPLGARRRGVRPGAGRPLRPAGQAAGRIARMRACPLPDALDRCRNVLPPYALPMIRVGWQSGALAPALRQAATVSRPAPVALEVAGRQSELPDSDAGLRAGDSHRSSWSGSSPSSRRCFGISALQLPRLTRQLIAVAAGSVNYWYLFVLFWLAAVLLLLYAALRHYGWIRWDLPGTGWLARRLDAANMHGRPGPGGRPTAAAAGGRRRAGPVVSEAEHPLAAVPGGG